MLLQYVMVRSKIRDQKPDSFVNENKQPKNYVLQTRTTNFVRQL